jgi:hypothetical protein
MSSVNIPATQAVDFPIQVSKTLVFLAKSQDDLDYLQNKDQNEDFIVDMVETSDMIGVELISVDGEVIKK